MGTKLEANRRIRIKVVDVHMGEEPSGSDTSFTIRVESVDTSDGTTIHTIKDNIMLKNGQTLDVIFTYNMD